MKKVFSQINMFMLFTKNSCFAPNTKGICNVIAHTPPIGTPNIPG